jgi:hypothetical protein
MSVRTKQEILAEVQRILGRTNPEPVSVDFQRRRSFLRLIASGAAVAGLGAVPFGGTLGLRGASGGPLSTKFLTLPTPHDKTTYTQKVSKTTSTTTSYTESVCPPRDSPPTTYDVSVTVSVGPPTNRGTFSFTTTASCQQSGKTRTVTRDKPTYCTTVTKTRCPPPDPFIDGPGKGQVAREEASSIRVLDLPHDVRDYRTRGSIGEFGLDFA